MTSAGAEPRLHPLPPSEEGRTRVLLVIDFIYAVTGGTENQFMKLFRGLDRDRFEVDVLSLRRTPWLVEHGETFGGRLGLCNIEKVRKPATAAEFVRLVRHIRSQRPDVVMTFFPISNIFGVLAARMAGVKSVWATRRDYGVWFNCAFRGDRHFLRFANRFVRGIVTNSTQVKKLVVELERYDPDKIRVIYNGIETATFGETVRDVSSLRTELGLPAEAPVVGIVAGLRPMKRHETFLRAAASVLQKRPECHFLLVGDGPRRTTLEELANRLRIEERCHFVGWRQDIARVLGLLDVGVNCSANEGLSNAIMEYLAAGVPCVVSAAGGNVELIEDGKTGFAFPLDDAETLADRILRLLDDKNLRARFAAGAKAFVRQTFTVEGMVAQYEELFTTMGNS